MSKSWSVTVEADGQQIVTIASNHLSGKSDLTAEDEDTIRTAARHLISFVGDPEQLFEFSSDGNRLICKALKDDTR